MSRVLVVANETVEAEELLAELRRIEDERSSTFFVVAPAVAAESRARRFLEPGGRHRCGAGAARPHARRAARRGPRVRRLGRRHGAVRRRARCARPLRGRPDRDLDASGARARAGCARTSSSRSARASTCPSCTSSRTCARRSPPSRLHPGGGAVDDRDGAAAAGAAQPLEALGDAVEIGQVRDHVGQHEPPVGRQLHERGELGGRGCRCRSSSP